MRPEPAAFEVERDGLGLAGEAVGEGAPLLLLHGLTATRRYVVHRSLVLPRRGFRVLAYDARGHGESDPAPDGAGYSYGELTSDLGAVLERQVGGSTAILAGHSMGAHTAVSHALQEADGVAALVLICPASLGEPLPDEVLTEWDELAEGLERDGVDGFLRAYEAQGLNPEWHETLLRIARERLLAQNHPEALARALREVPRSLPFEGLSELEFVQPPTLIVASRDEADPGHPYAVAEEWARRIPGASLVSEPEGSSPLAWQGGRLSREIAGFCEEPAVRERLGTG